MLAVTILFHLGPCEPKPRWQDAICEPHKWHHAPPYRQMLAVILVAALQLFFGWVLIGDPKYGKATGGDKPEYFEGARKGACAFRNVNENGDSSASSWGVAHLIYGCWVIFWALITRTLSLASCPSIPHGHLRVMMPPCLLAVSAPLPSMLHCAFPEFAISQLGHSVR